MIIIIRLSDLLFVNLVEFGFILHKETDFFKSTLFPKMVKLFSLD